MGNFGESLVTIATAIIGVALLAVLVSRNAKTADVIGSAGRAFSTAIRTATGPVSGNAFRGNEVLGPGYGSFGNY